MLFGKKEKNKNASADINTGTTGPAEPAPYSVPASAFSARIGTVFARMYLAVFSADITAGIYKLESGKARISGVDFKPSGKYDDLITALSGAEVTETGLSGLEPFKKENMIAAFRAGRSSVGTICCLKEEGETLSFHYAELSADLIPDKKEAGEKYRCIIFVREINGKDDSGFTAPPSKAQKAPEGLPENWENESVSIAYGGRNAMLFTYDVAADVLTLKNSEETSAITNFLAGISSRADWLFFHDDVRTLKELFEDALKGNHVKGKLRLRKDARKNLPFHLHKIAAAPVYDGVNVIRIMGAFSDIEEETNELNAKLEMTKNVDACISRIYPNMYEINMTEDRIYEISDTGSGFARSGDGKSFSEYIARIVKYQAADDETAANYSSLLKKGFLEKKTVGDINYEFESQLIKPGHTTANWFNETFYRLPGSGRYLNICRNIEENWKQRDKSYREKSEKYMSEYNGRMLAVMAELVEFRNIESGAHIGNVCELTRILLNDISERLPDYDLDARTIDKLVQAAMMHDVGKITLPDKILNKPGKLTKEEYEIMKTHAAAGCDIIDKMNIQGQDELIGYCKDISLHHHERYDGNGYPEGLAGDDISIGAQVVGLADAFDAMASKRCYKDAFPADYVMKTIIEGGCGAFNPKLIDSLKACEKKIIPYYESKTN